MEHLEFLTLKAKAVIRGYKLRHASYIHESKQKGVQNRYNSNDSERLFNYSLKVKIASRLF